MSRHGDGRHRQAWIEVICVWCGQTVKARPTLPGHPLHVRTHLDENWDACPPLPHRARTLMELHRDGEL